VQNQCKTLLENRHILFDLYIQPEIKEVRIGDSNKQNVFLIIKEALNNMLKYSGAGNLQIRAEQTGKKVRIVIADDGKGFDLEQAAKRGNGLRNMRERALELPSGTFHIESGKKGTRIQFEFEI
jgi:signal transduction histidine kinase